MPFGANSPTDSKGNIEIAIQDQFTEILDLYLLRQLDTLTLDVNANLDDTIIRVSTTGVVPVSGNFVCLKEGQAFYQGEITAVAPVSGNQYDLTLNVPLDYPFTTVGGCSLNTPNMNVNGSVTPQVYRVSPDQLTPGIQWDITRMILLIRDDAAMDDGTFGGIVGGLPKGIVLRQKMNGTRKNIFNARTNGDFRLRAFDVQYVDPTLGPSGQYAVGVRRSFNGLDKNGVTVRLANDNDPDEFQLIVNDNLTSLTFFRVVVQGHVVE